MLNEVAIFHIDDPSPALHFCDLPHQLLFDLCVRSIRQKSPGSHITLLTDGRTNISKGYQDIEVIRDESIRSEYIMYERSRVYRDHIARRLANKSMLGIVFMDIDILVNRNLSEVFSYDFDVGLTFRIVPGILLDDRGLPANSQVSPINGGVIFMRPTEASLSFCNEQMRIYDQLHAEGNIQMTMVEDIRKWGGDQFALMAMMGKKLVESGPNPIVHAGATVRFFSCEYYNYTPEIGQSIDKKTLEEKLIIHMKGPRKAMMPNLALFIGIE